MFNSCYPKIATFFKRDPATNFKTVLVGQYATPVFEYLAFSEFEWSEKYDGTNIRVVFDGITVTFGGKTDAAQIPAKLFTHLAREFTIDTLTKVLDPTKLSPECPAVLYGEGVGAGIQKRGEQYGSVQHFVLFDIAVGGMFLRRTHVEDIAYHMGINITPIVGIGNMWEAVLFARGNKDIEGVVCRPREELQDRLGNRIITKLKYQDFSHPSKL